MQLAMQGKKLPEMQMRVDAYEREAQRETNREDIEEWKQDDKVA